MLQKTTILNQIQASGIIAVIRANTGTAAIQISDAVIAGGISAIELTFTVPQANQAIENLITKYQNTNVVIGAGTVLDVTSARLAILAGAQFVVSPSFNSNVAKICNLYQIPYIPGCQTITEMQRALSTGVDIIKLFPGTVAGPQMVKAVKAPLPQLNIMPTGGISLDNMEDWFNAGVIAIGTGSSLTKPAENGDLNTVSVNAQKYVTKLNKIRHTI